MIKKILIIAIFLAEFSVAFAGNPIIVIRCGLVDVEATTSTGSAFLFAGGSVCEDENTVSFAGHCYPLPVEGSCAGVIILGFDDLELTPQDETIDGVLTTICVPDCSTAPFSEDSRWSGIRQECVCEDDGSSSCGCPEGLEEASTGAPGIVDGSGGCVAPEKACYNAGLTVNVEPFICDVESAATQEIKILLTKAPTLADPNPVWLPTDAVTLADLENCNLLNESNEIIGLVNTDGAFGGDARPAFVPIDDGMGNLIIEIVFTRDPSQASVISFLGDSNDPITIPECPRVFDPCSCRPENITDADGVVLYWYDELTFTGNPNEQISVASNNIPQGFTDATQTPFSGVVGTTDGTGLLVVPFYREVGFDTDVVLMDAQSQTANLMSSCSLSANACSNIVPTMGEWSVMILSLLMLILGIVAMKHKSATLIPIKERVRK